MRLPAPAGAQWDGNWQPDDSLAYRIITTVNRHIDGHPLELGLTANQFCDGRIDADREPPTVNVQLCWEDGLSASPALALVDAALDLGRWTEP